MNMITSVFSRWTPEDAAELYCVRNWSNGYFDVSDNGHVLVKPKGRDSSLTVDLYEIVKELTKKGHSMPMLIRFADILACQIRDLNESFRKAIRDAKYQSVYQPVYPIKVNQKQLVLHDIIEFGKKYHQGLEAGSKAELIAAVANVKSPHSCIVCNGYKDEEFIDLALQALKMGLQTIIVLEMPSELPLVLERAKILEIKPILGVRAKLSSRAGGHWDGSGGDRSKFGLNASQITELVDLLRDADMLDSLKMLHYHLGSQITDIRRIRNALQEACRFYVNLVEEGATMGMLNIGGGLAVDYDGSHTNFASSSNYTMQEYAADVIEVIMKNADDAGIPHPKILSESGRATIAHHSVLLFNVLDVRKFEPYKLPEELPEDSIQMLKNLMDTRNALSPRNIQEIYHDAVYYRDEIRAMFLHGNATLRERALAENIFWDIVTKIAALIQNRKYVPDELQGIDQALADVYYCNFSLFQSLPDSWAIDHLFPIMPIHRLAEIPTRHAVLADITCDSDGKIDIFTDLHDVKKSLPLHEPSDDEDYIIGVFLVGAYQETLGDMHNLLGTTNVIHVRISEKDEPQYVREVPGDTVKEVLSYVEYNPREAMRRIAGKAEKAFKTGIVNRAEKNAIVAAFSCGMDGYTYFEK